MKNHKIKIIYLGLALFLLPSYLIRFSLFGIPTTLLEILIYLGVIWAMFHPKDWQKLKTIPLKIWLPVLFFVLSAIIGVLVAPAKTQALGQLKGFIIDPLIFVGLVYLWTPKEKINWLYDSLILSGIVLSLIALWQKLYHIQSFDGRTLSVWQWDPSASPNYLSMYLAPIAVLFFCRLGNFKNGKKLIDWLPGFILVVLAIIWSGSRGGLLSAGAGILYFYTFSLLNLHKASRTIKTIIISLVVLASVGLLFIWGKPDFAVTPDSGRISSSNNIRWEIWQVTIKEIIPQHWLLGVGLGNFQNHFTKLTQNRVNFPEFISPQALTPHNLFLTLLANGGIIMLGSILVLLYFLYADPKNSDNISKAVMLSIIVYGLVDTPFFKNDLSIIFWLIIIAYVVKNYHKTQKT